MAKLIGRGAFTKAYLIDGRVHLKSSDQIKECMAFGWFPSSDLFPSVTISHLDGYDYEMDYFPRVSSLKNNLDAPEYAKYLTLRALAANARVPSNTYDGYSVLYGLVESLECEDLRDDLLEALDGCSNCGSDIWFEISPRNVAVKNGKLVLMDCFYSISALHAKRAS